MIVIAALALLMVPLRIAVQNPDYFGVLFGVLAWFGINFGILVTPFAVDRLGGTKNRPPPQSPQ
jgi:hypothetical protein